MSSAEQTSQRRQQYEQHRQSTLTGELQDGNNQSGFCVRLSVLTF